jgi:hypothetical protein
MKNNNVLEVRTCIFVYLFGVKHRTRFYVGHFYDENLTYCLNTLGLPQDQNHG